MIYPLEYRDNYLDAFEFGRGVFETLLIVKGKALDLECHLRRLNKSLHFFGVKGTIEAKTIEKEIKGCLDHFDFKTLKIVVYIEGENGFYTIKLSPYRYDFNTLERPVKVGISDVVIDASNILCYHKTLNYFENILMLNQANKDGFFDLIKLNTSGNITEGYKSNVFIKREGHWFTPPVEAGILNGVARQFFINHLIKTNTLYIEDISIKSFKCADVVMLSNSLIGCVAMYNKTSSEKDIEYVNKLRKIYFWR